MVACMNKVAKSDVELVTEERNLLSVAYKNVIGARRASWRVVKSMQDKEEKSGCAEEKINLLKDYKEKIEEELSAICKEINDLIDTHLLQNTSDPESLVFYNKMKGDYYRYQAEYVDSEKEQPKIAGESLKAYKAASDTANNQLASTNPIRLGLALNFSVFYYEIIKKPVLACRLAKAAFDDAIAELDAVPEVDYKDSTLIMQLLRDNLTLWTTDLQGDDDKCDVEDLEVEAAE